MSNPTELPDLDRGYFKRKLATVIRDLSSYTAPEMARELVRLAKVADESEAVKEARRAQPEGEAPQAEPVAYLRWWARQIDEGHGNIGHEEGFEVCEPDELSDDGSPAFAVYDRMPRVVVPSAQHADNGAPAMSDDLRRQVIQDTNDTLREQAATMLAQRKKIQSLEAALAAQSQGAQDDRAAWCKECIGQGIDTDPPEPGEDGICRACSGSGLAAQQAAAPGALDLMNADEMAALRRFDETCQDGEGYDVPKTMMQRLAAIGVVRRTSGSYYETTEFGLRVLHQSAPIAPGTPEAPDEDSKGIELWRATLRACGELPEGYEVRIELENGCGMAVWYDAEGERHVIDGEGYLSDDVNEAVDAAIQRAAQLDGGKGEGK